MCGRFFLSTAEGRRIVFPTDTVWVRAMDGWRQMTWGFRGPDTRPLINARAETAAQKPTFRDALRYRRCLVPADGYFEWRREAGRRTKDCFRLMGEEGNRLMMAGLYNLRGEFVIVTQPPNAQVAPLHDRMPVVLATPETQALWLSRADMAEVLLASQPDAALHVQPETENIAPKRRQHAGQTALPLDG